MSERESLCDALRQQADRLVNGEFVTGLEQINLLYEAADALGAFGEAGENVLPGSNPGGGKYQHEAGAPLDPASPKAPDHHILCLACGCIAPEYQWTYWQRGEDDGWRRSEPGEGDPMMRCPSCGWEHVDDDSGNGIFDGTHSEALAYAREVEPRYAEDWDARHAEIGTSGRPRSESETRCPICEKVIREDDLYEDGCPFCGTWIEQATKE